MLLQQRQHLPRGTQDEQRPGDEPGDEGSEGPGDERPGDESLGDQPWEIIIKLQQATIERLTEETEQLQRALNSRIIVEQAKGLVAGAAQVDVAEAFNLIRVYGRNRNLQLHDLCAAIIKTATGGTEPGEPDSQSPGSSSPSPARLSRAVLYEEIMQTWRERAPSTSRAWKVG